MNMIPRSFLLILCLFSATGWALDNRLDMAGLVKLLLAQGYHDIREMELEGDKFEVRTLNRQDEKVHLIVDAYTGEIKQKEAD
ncbi:PepSY domain-containing protein [Aeromonas enteropelogenes]|uniref:PepSY domain-containing protein n=1 Tax=Aeromonas enteropelogenes TaxID=29489 RepID=UPI003BA271AC